MRMFIALCILIVLGHFKMDFDGLRGIALLTGFIIAAIQDIKEIYRKES